MTQFYFLPVVDPKKWRARIIDFRSPLWFRVFLGRWVKDNYFIAWPIGEEGTLLQVSIRNGLADIPKTGMTKIAKKLGAEVSSEDTVASLLIKIAEPCLVAAPLCLPCCPPARPPDAA